MKKYFIFQSLETEGTGIVPSVTIEVKDFEDAKAKWEALKGLITLPEHWEAYYLESYTSQEGKPSRKVIIERR